LTAARVRVGEKKGPRETLPRSSLFPLLTAAALKEIPVKNYFSNYI